MNKSYLTRLLFVGGLGAGSVALVSCLLMLTAPPAQAQNPGSYYPEVVVNAAPKQLDTVNTANATPGDPADYPQCDLFVTDQGPPISDDAYGCQYEEQQRCRSVQRAINVAQDPGTVICVSGGDYSWSQIQTYGALGMVDIQKSLIILGGWDYDFAVRDPIANPSILDAEGNDRVVYINGYITPVIDGFHILSGYRSTIGGGGLYVDDAQTIIANCLIANNVVSRSVGVVNGGGIYFNYAHGSQVLSSTIRGNFSDGRGGGVYALSSQRLLVQNTNVISNVTEDDGIYDYGGGLYWAGACLTATLRDVDISNNVAGSNWGGLYLSGDGPTLERVRVDNNTASGNYGGLHVEGNDITLAYVTITNNTANGIYIGGGEVEGSHASLSHVVVQNNRNVNPQGDYGGLRVWGGASSVLTNVVVSGNEAGDDFGGLYLASIGARMSYVTVTHNTAYGQSASSGAAGLYVYYDSITLTHVLVMDNVGLGAGGDGNPGGLYIRDGDDATLQYITVVGNSSSYNYSGLYLFGDNATLEHITIDSNAAQNLYGGLYVSGNDNTLSDLTVLSNTAAINYGGFYLTGVRTRLDHFEVRHNRVLTTTDCTAGGIHIVSNYSTLENGTVSDNWGCFGGGLYLENGPYTLTDSLIADNHASVEGGGLYLESHGLVKNSYIVGNQAATGGGVYMTGGFGTYYTLVNSFVAENQASVDGDGIYANRNGVLINDTLVSNGGQGVLYDTSASFVLVMTNTIIASHTLGIESRGEGMVVNDYTLFAFNAYNYSGTVDNGSHNIGGDPAFAEPGNRDYHITSASAAVNQGATVAWLTDDYDREPRPNGPYYDIGADESYEKPVEGAYFTYAPPEPIFGQSIRFIGDVLTGTPPIDYAWDFGDGTGGLGRNPLHLYPAPGSYAVVMTASNNIDGIYYYDVYSEVVAVVLRSLLLEPDWVTVTSEGQVVYFEHVLTNTGNVSDSYHLQANSLQGWPVSVSPQVAPLPAGEQTTVWVAVTVPWGSASFGQIGRTIITATSQAAPSVYDIAIDDIIVATANTEPGVALSPGQNGSDFAGRKLTYQHVLTNTGNGADFFQLEVASALGWTTVLSPSGGLQLDSSHTSTLQLQVTIPAGTPPGQSDVATIKATSLVSPAVSASITDTSTVLEIVRDVRLEPDWEVVAEGSGPISFVHTLTNTGNFTDSFDLTAASSQGWALAWTENPTGPLATGQAKTVLLTVTVPDGVQNVIDYTVITATSQADVSVYDSATNEIIVPGPSRQPGVALSPGGSVAAYASETVVYQHIVTNTGDGPDRFGLAAGSSQGWTLILEPERLVLSSGQTATLHLSVTIPADAPIGQVDVASITATSTVSPAVFASAADTTTVAAIPRGASLEPDHLVIANENDQLHFNHVLTNTGVTTDSFDLDLSYSEDWPIDWTAGPFGPLAAGEWALVRVTVTVPFGSAGQIDQIVLTATSQADEMAYDTATDVIAVLAENPQPGVTLVPDRSSSARPGQVATYLHTLTNTGNGADYFRLEAVSSLGWTAVPAPSPGILLDSGESATVRVSVVVPEDATQGQIDVTTLTATSLLAPAVNASVTDQTRVLGQGPADYFIYLPIVLREG